MKKTIKQPITIIGADKHDQPKIGWSCQTYSGYEIFLVPKKEIKTIEDIPKTPITNKKDLQCGMRVITFGLFGYIQLEVAQDTYGILYGENDGLIVPFYFGEDDRHCWVAGCHINKKCIQKLENK